MNLIEICIYITFLISIATFTFTGLKESYFNVLSKNEANKIYVILKKELFFEDVENIILENKKLCLSKCYSLNNKLEYKDILRTVNDGVINKSFSIIINNQYKVVVNNINNIGYANLRVEKYEK